VWEALPAGHTRFPAAVLLGDLPARGLSSASTVPALRSRTGSGDMSERISFRHSDAIWYTTGTLEQVCEDLNAGRPIAVYGFASNGERFEESMIFYGLPDWVSTDHVKP
jgi:hypothetical protein